LSFFAELKRRKVFKAVAAYGVTAWLILQIADIALESFAAPGWMMQAILIVLVLGFPVVAILAWAFELTRGGFKRDTGQASVEGLAPLLGRRFDAIIIGFLAIAVCLLLVDRFAFQPEVDREPSDQSIAVLPFVNMSQDNDYFSDGITEEILNSLAAVTDLRVAGRTSSFAFKGRNEDLRVIGDALGVAYILEGSVRKAGNKIRITAQLIDVSDGFHLWSETFERELTDVFVIQDEIATAIQTNLKATLLGGEDSIAARETEPEAFQLYLQAKSRLRERKGPAIIAASDLLDQAMAIDDTYAPVLAQKALSVILQMDSQYGDVEQQEAIAQARPLIERALELDPKLADAWAVSGLMLGYEDSSRAIEALETAIRLNPSLLEAKLWLSYELGSLTPRAFELSQEINRVDPLFAPAASELVSQYLTLGESDAAEAIIDKVLSIDPVNPSMLASRAALLRNRGQFADALKTAERAIQLDNSVATRFEADFIRTALFQLDSVESFTSPLALISLELAGQHAEALALSDREHVPLPLRILVLSRQQRYEQVITTFEKNGPSLAVLSTSTNQGESLMLAMVALAYQRRGDQAAAQNVTGALTTKLALPTIQPVTIDSSVLALLTGNTAEAMDTIEVLVKREASTGFLLLAFPVYSAIEDEPRFQALEAQYLELVNSERSKLGLVPVRSSDLCVRDHCGQRFID